MEGPRDTQVLRHALRAVQDTIREIEALNGSTRLSDLGGEADRLHDVLERLRGLEGELRALLDARDGPGRSARRE